MAQYQVLGINKEKIEGDPDGCELGLALGVTLGDDDGKPTGRR